MTLKNIKVLKTSQTIKIFRSKKKVDKEIYMPLLIKDLDNYLGAIYASHYDYPGRYDRWEIGFVKPPLRIVSKSEYLSIEALNERGKLILKIFREHFEGENRVKILCDNSDQFSCEILKDQAFYFEEQRSRKNSIFSFIREFINIFKVEDDSYLGLYGAFAFDIIRQFEVFDLKKMRPDRDQDMILYFPDQLFIHDKKLNSASLYTYEFEYKDQSTVGMPIIGLASKFKLAVDKERFRYDPPKGDYAKKVKKAIKAFKRGDLFEVVLSQTFKRACRHKPSKIFEKLMKLNPSPYGFLINLGNQEYLVGASPEMYVRCKGKRIETCPISGTIARGVDSISDSEQILKLLSSPKDKSELTMCTDVDRNDKSRICKPGSVKIIGRQQIEKYSKLFHTVDHVEGILRESYDALDAFLSHTWAVTVTGAPKLWAIRFIEEHELDSRAWYGGSVGFINFNGNMNTGLTLRTIRIVDQQAEIRVGATLLADSDPDAEELETELKASALLEIIEAKDLSIFDKEDDESIANSMNFNQTKVLMIDHDDSFVNLLASYFCEFGAEVKTMRSSRNKSILVKQLEAYNPNAVILSPGPGKPKDFNMHDTIELLINKNLPIFGVCLGLQGLVEYFGGKLTMLQEPMHGKESQLKILYANGLFRGLPQSVSVGRYHSMHAVEDSLSNDLIISAKTNDGVVMAIEHKSLPISAVQFHPESLMSAKDHIGKQIVHNVLKLITAN